MKLETARKQTPRVLLLLLTMTLAWSSGHAEASLDTLDNGMELILLENHSSPMIASVIFVRSGSKYETEYENGIAHFLEHLLFDGTVHLNRQELDRSIRDLGGYINAFTREDLTAYLVLLPRQYIEHGLTVQADMLFNSVFPEDELAKERRVVIEEIKRSNDTPGAAAEAFFTRQAYGHTDYGRPVLGYEPFIANLPREAIIAYWKKHYTPDQMTALVIGDFETSEVKRLLAGVFERFPRGEAGDTALGSRLHERLAEAKRRGGQVAGQRRYDTVAAVTSTYIDFSIAAPDLDSPDYLPFDLLVQYLALDEISPLKKALQGGADPLATEVSLSLPTWPELTRLDIGIITEKPELRDSIVATTLQTLTQMSSSSANSGDLQGIKTTLRCDAIYNAERLHHYSFLIAPMMMTAGWDWIQSYPDRLNNVTWELCQTAAGRWLDIPDYVVTVVRPTDSGEVGCQAERPTGEEVIAYFDTAAFHSYDLEKGYELAYPQTDSVTLELVDPSVYRREVLENGLTVLIKSNQSSRVFAASILGRNRSAFEPNDKAGLTDFVNRCLAGGTSTRTTEQLRRDLAATGAHLTLHDNPWIPYDDRYTTRSFSFIKFETIEPYAEAGFALLADLVLNPLFDSAEVENVRQEMLGILGRSSGSPSQVARDLYFARLFEGHPFSKPIMGSPQSLAAITRDDLRDHHQRFYSPGNMILAVVTSRDTSEAMGWVRATFGSVARLDSRAIPAVPALLPGYSDGEFHRDLNKEQIAIYAGGRLPGAGSEEAPDLQVAASILSSRLFEILRERQGLAYSTGAGAAFDRDFGWYYVNIATGSENYQSALDGLTVQSEKLALDGPQEAEVRRAKNQIWGRLMSARLSRINQAFYLALDDFLGYEPGSDRGLLDRLEKVSVLSARRAAARHFRPSLWVTASAGRRP